MKKITGGNFGVRFYRRGVARTATRAAANNAVPPVAATMPGEKQESVKLAMLWERVVGFAKEQAAAQDNGHKTAAASIDAAPMAVPADNHMRQALPEPEKKARGLEARLHRAAEAGDSPAIRLLVMEGADLDARDAQGRTALNIATQHNHTQAIKTLLAAREMRRMAAHGELPDTGFFRKFKKSGTDSP
ncbi:MAG: ankyrin repeat domain-containing protein [Micavibrio sp.]